jgi:YjjI family glycine radical enzyme
MFGIHGLAECANHLSGARNKSEKFGNSTKTDDLGVRIMDALETEINKYNNKYCKISNGKFVLHAQCGIGSDVETSPGARINPEDEPEIFEKIQQNSRFHKYFPSGTSDIFQFDEMSKKNPQYVLDIIKGAMKAGLRTFAFGTSNCEVVRITGYLVKRRDIEKYKIGEKTLEDTVVLGLESTKSLNIEKRRVNQISGKQLK